MPKFPRPKSQEEKDRRQATRCRLVKDHLFICAGIIVFYFQSRRSIGSNRKLELISGEERRLITSLLTAGCQWPGEVAQAMLDVTAADADRRLDQMSVITSPAHAWELTRKACSQLGSGSEGVRGPERYYRGRSDGPMASREAGICTTALSVPSKTERTDAAFDVQGSRGAGDRQSHSLKPLMELVSLMGL